MTDVNPFVVEDWEVSAASNRNGGRGIRRINRGHQFWLDKGVYTLRERLHGKIMTMRCTEKGTWTIVYFDRVAASSSISVELPTLCHYLRADGLEALIPHAIDVQQYTQDQVNARISTLKARVKSMSLQLAEARADHFIRVPARPE